MERSMVLLDWRWLEDGKAVRTGNTLYGLAEKMPEKYAGFSKAKQSRTMSPVH